MNDEEFSKIFLDKSELSDLQFAIKYIMSIGLFGDEKTQLRYKILLRKIDRLISECKYIYF